MIDIFMKTGSTDGTAMIMDTTMAKDMKDANT